MTTDIIVVLQVTPIFSIEDDSFAEPFEIQTQYDSELARDIPNLLSVNQLLESVCQPFRPLLCKGMVRFRMGFSLHNY